MVLKGPRVVDREEVEDFRDLVLARSIRKVMHSKNMYVHALTFSGHLCNPFGCPQSVDLTELAKEGKLDPTIGRDEGMKLFNSPFIA